MTVPETSKLQTEKRVIAAFQRITWSFSKVKALGVWFSTIEEESEFKLPRQKKIPT